MEAAAMRRMATLALGLVAFGSPALAQEDTGLFALGSLACSDWNRAPNFANAGLKDWLLRFTAHLASDGSYLTNPMTRTTPQQTVAWVDAYCEANPLTGLAVVGMTMINQLSAQHAEAR
jgi:hypothetical protein